MRTATASAPLQERMVARCCSTRSVMLHSACNCRCCVRSRVVGFVQSARTASAFRKTSTIGSLSWSSELPPLRERPEDIPGLATTILAMLGNATLSKQAEALGAKWATSEEGRGLREVVRELGLDAR